MSKKQLFGYFAVLGILLLISGRPAFANKSSVRIEAPAHAAVGQEITIILHVSHDGNNFLHYTDWVYVTVNGEELKRWEFGMFGTPESENFICKITYTVTGPTVITAEADCNLHGSTGIVEHTVAVP